MSRLRVRDLLAMAQRDLEQNGRPYAAVFPSQVRHLAARFGDRDAVEIAFEDLEEYKLERVRGGAARETVNKELGALSKGFALAVAARFIEAMAVPRIRRLSPGEPRQGFLPVDDFRRIAEELVRRVPGRTGASGPEAVRDVCEWAYWSGWRRGECFGLEWERVGDGWAWCRDKSGRRKQAPLSGPLGPILERRRVARLPGCRWVFHRAGRPIRSLRRAWDAACSRAGLPGRVFHDLRRSFVRNAIRAGVDRDTVMALSGHRTHEVFSRYNIQDEADLLEAAERLAALSTSWTQARLLREGVPGARGVRKSRDD